VAVRVLDCSGSGTDLTVLSGINWVRAQPNTVRCASRPFVPRGGLLTSVRRT
jgi:hypothetical protein